MFARRSIKLTFGAVQKTQRALLSTTARTADISTPCSHHSQEHPDTRENIFHIPNKKKVAEVFRQEQHRDPVVYCDSLLSQHQHAPLSPLAVVQARVDAGASASFLVTNLTTIRNMHAQWVQELPMIRPFYAVKCNPDPSILRLLASLGCGFDCASQGEIELVLHKLGKEHNFSAEKASSSIIYAHPAKMEHMLRYALDQGVGMTVFDGEDELLKIASMEGFRDMQVLLRLTTDDESSVCRFSKKFGCPVDEAGALLELAQRLGVPVVGCSFHVGSGCGDSQAYSTALQHCRRVFQAADQLGMPPLTVVDIGGGFPGDTGGYGGPDMPTFQDLAKTIRQGIAAFCDGGWTTKTLDDFRFIAEPGRYFVSASTCIATKVYARKGGRSSAQQALYVDDGVYGSFNNVVYDHATPVPRRIAPGSQSASLPSSASELMPTAVFGPTCDGLDQLCAEESTRLPRCDVGDWLVFENCGAYTHTASFFFNGYTHVPTKLYCNYTE